MIRQDEIKVTDSGGGFVIGEMPERHKHFTYLRSGALVALFDGLDNMLEFVAKKMPTAKQSKSSSDTGDGGFHSFRTYSQALKTFRSEPEKIVEFDPAELRIKDTDEAGNQVDFDVVGDYIDMGRYMEGIPETFGTMHQGNARNRRVNLTVNLSHAWRVDHKDITHRGERILRLVDGLEAGGVRTRLTGIESTECAHIEVLLKRHDEPLTISDLAVVTHPEFLRRILFRVDEYSKTWDWGYGSSIIFSRKLTPEVIEGDIIDELNIVVDGNLNGKKSIDRVFDQLERLLVWEMSKPTPEVSSIKLDGGGIWFNPNGARAEADIRREGQEVINDE